MTKSVFIILCLLLTSCSGSCIKFDEIKIIYLPGTGDYPTEIPKSLFLNFCYKDNDTIYLPQEDFDSIYSYASNGLLDTLKDQSNARIFLRINNRNYMIGEDIKLTSNKYDNVDKLRVQYFIKDKIGYYNRIDKNRLYDFREVRIWGIPHNYHYEVMPDDRPKKEIYSLILLRK